MKYASSIRYGGQLIEAADVDYGDYKKLGLLCPNCKEPVFLQGQSVRHNEKKEVLVPPHFKHFVNCNHGNIKECELRVASYGIKEINLASSQSRDQRLKLLQQNFWKILVDNADCVNPHGNFGQNPVKDTMLKFVNGILDGGIEIYRLPEYNKPLNKKMQPSRANFEKWIVSCIQNQDHLQLHIKNYLRTPPCGAWEQRISHLKSQLDVNFHEMILIEIANFLFAGSSINLLEKCIAFSFFRVTNAGVEILSWFLKQMDDGYVIASPLLCGLAMELVTIDWAKKLSELEAGVKCNLSKMKA